MRIERSEISIRAWFYSRALFPVCCVVAVFALSTAYYLFKIHRESQNRRSALASYLSSSIEVALSQKNRLLLERTLSFGVMLEGINGIYICQDDDLIASDPPMDSPCKAPSGEAFTIRSQPGITAYFTFGNLPTSNWFPFIVGLAMLIAVCSLLLWVSRRIRTEIVAGFSNLEQSIGNSDSAGGHSFTFSIKEFSDISTRIGLLLKERQDAEKSKAIAQAVMMLAHDIRRPFSAIKVFMQMIESRKTRTLEDIVSNFTPTLKKTIQNVEGMLDDMLEVGRDRREVKKTDLDFVEVLNSALTESYTTHLAQRKSPKRLSFVYQLKHSKSLFGDSKQLSRMFSNIIMNAIDATPQDGALWFKTSDSSVNGSIGVNITFGNSGSFLTEEECLRVFHPLFTKNKVNGKGLGLAIVQKIANDHGGTVSCQSSIDAGTEFTLLLPAGETSNCKEIPTRLPNTSDEIRGPNSPETSESEEEKREQKDKNTILQKLKNSQASILIIDDEPVYSGSLGSFIENDDTLRDSIKVLTATNYNSAQALLEKKDVKMIICDIDMGSESMSGHEIVSRLRQNNYDCLIVMHSNRMHDTEIEKARAAGANHFQVKPMSKPLLVQFIARALS